MKQQDVVFVDGYIHDGARGIDDFSKSVAGHQLPSHQVFDVRGCDHAVDGGTQLGAIQTFAGASQFRGPVVGLDS